MGSADVSYDSGYILAVFFSVSPWGEAEKKKTEGQQRSNKNKAPPPRKEWVGRWVTLSQFFFSGCEQARR